MGKQGSTSFKEAETRLVLEIFKQASLITFGNKKKHKYIIDLDSFEKK
jgi:hypothetical protein